MVTNPVVGAILGFRADILMLFGGGRLFWVTELTAIVSKTNLEATWWKDVPDSFYCTAVGAPALVTLAKIVGKLWPHRLPDWVAVLQGQGFYTYLCL